MKRKNNLEDKSITHLRNKHENNSLDSFADQDNQDDIFDSDFSKEDFLRSTKKWKQKNLTIIPFR